MTGVPNAAKTGNKTICLTLLGGGAFGKAESWIMTGTERSLWLLEDFDLDVAIDSYGSSNTSIQQFVARRKM